MRQPLVRIIVTALFIWLIFRAINVTKVVHALVGVSWKWITIAELLIALSVVVQILVWKLLLDINAKPLKWRQLASLYLQGLLFSHVLPGTFCGDAFRLFRTSQLIGEAPAASSIIASRTAELAGTLATGLVAVITLPPAFGALRWVAAFCLVAASIAVYYLIFSARLPGHVIEWVAHVAGKRLAQTVRDTADAYETYRKHPQILIWCIVLSAMAWWLLVASMIFFATAVGVHIPWSLFAVAVPLSVATALVPISFNGVGLREAVFVGICAAARVDVPDAMAVAILIDLQLLPMIIVGAWFWLIDR